LNSLRASAQQMNHPYATLGYGIEGDSVSVCYLNGHEPSCEEVGRDGALTPSRLDLIGNEGDRHYAEYMTNADVVIHETQYTPKNIRQEELGLQYLTPTSCSWLPWRKYAAWF
jgi:hypothetical protein